MQSRLGTLEEGKEPVTASRTNHSRPFPLRLLKFFLLFLIVGIGASIVSIFMVRRFGINTVALVQSSSFKPCFEQSGSIESWIRPPSNLLHTMNDIELFWKASFVPGIKSYPFKRTPKIAFMFWGKFFKGHEGLYSIYVHSLPSYTSNFPPSSVFYRRQIPSQVLKFNLTESGLFCVLPWLTMALAANLGGWIADTLVSKGLSVTRVRKIMQTIGFLGLAFFLTQLSRITSPAMAVLCMTCSQYVTPPQAGAWMSWMPNLDLSS